MDSTYSLQLMRPPYILSCQADYAERHQQIVLMKAIHRAAKPSVSGSAPNTGPSVRMGSTSTFSLATTFSRRLHGVVRTLSGLTIMNLSNLDYARRLRRRASAGSAVSLLQGL